MNRRAFAGALLGAASVLLLPACGNSVTGTSFEPIRYKITAVVETPQGLRSGHSVLEYRGSMSGSMFGSQGGSGFSVRGEAVAVEVAPGQVMFVTLRTPTDQDFPANVLNVIEIPQNEGPSPSDRAGQMERTRRMYDRIRANRDIHPLWRPRDQRPGEGPWRGVYFVRFRDINDPRTVEEVNPDDLARTFGPRVQAQFAHGPGHRRACHDGDREPAAVAAQAPRKPSQVSATHTDRKHPRSSSTERRRLLEA